MNDEFKALTIADLGRIAERCKADGYDAVFEHVADILIMGNADVHRWPPQFVKSVQRIAREILAESTSSEALKRAARVEELDKAATPGPWRNNWDEPPHPGFDEHAAVVPTSPGATLPIVGSFWWNGLNCACTRENAAFIAETRTLAPALAADVRAYDAALRELVEALDERERVVPLVVARADDTQAEADMHFGNALRARRAQDQAAYDEHKAKQAHASQRAEEASKFATAEKIRCTDRVERAIDAARKVLG